MRSAKSLAAPGGVPLLLVAACALGCQTVRVQATFDEGTDFAGYRTFTHAPAPEVGENLPGYSAITGRQIQDRISENLEREGLRVAVDEEADLLVAFSVSGRPESEIWGTGGFYDWIGGVGGETQTINYIRGTLIIDIFDQKRQTLVWHGWGEQDVFESTADPKRASEKKVSSWVALAGIGRLWPAGEPP